MTRAGTEYSQDVIQRAVMFTAMTGTPGDPRSYKYTLAVERLKNEYGIDVPESTLRHWVAAHPDYIGAARIALDLSIDQKLKDIISRGLELTHEALKLLKVSLGNCLVARQAASPAFPRSSGAPARHGPVPSARWTRSSSHID